MEEEYKNRNFSLSEEKGVCSDRREDMSKWSQPPTRLRVLSGCREQEEGERVACRQPPSRRGPKHTGLADWTHGERSGLFEQA